MQRTGAPGKGQLAGTKQHASISQPDAERVLAPCHHQSVQSDLRFTGTSVPPNESLSHLQ